VINTNLPPILHRFRDIASIGPKSIYLATPLAFNPLPQRRGSPYHIILCDISLKNQTLSASFCHRKFRRIFNHYYAGSPRRYWIRWNNAKYGPLRLSRSFKVTDLGTNRKLIYDFLLVINTNLPPVLHRFRDTAFAFNTPPTRRRGSPETISVKFSVDVWMAKVPNAVETLPKNFNRLSKVHERYRRQTDDRRQTDGR